MVSSSLRKQITTVIYILAIGLILSQLYTLNHYDMPKLELPQPKTIKPLEYFDHIYLESMNETETNQMSATKTKLNKLKEKEMKTDFMDKVSEYVANIDHFRDLLSRSNPISLIGIHQIHPYYSKGSFKFDTLHQNIINEKNYCDMTDFYFLFSHKYNEVCDFYTDYAEEGQVRTSVLSVIGNDLAKLAHQQNRPFHLIPSVDLFFTKESNFHHYHQMGVNFLCPFQLYNHIPELENINQIDEFARDFLKYQSNYDADHKKSCFSENVVLPKVFHLQDKTQCRKFIDEIKSESQSYNTYWLSSSKGTGDMHFEMTQKMIEKSAANVKQTSDCSASKELTNKIARKLIINPLIISNSKVHLRSYMLFASTDPVIVYYNPGFITYIKHEERDSVKSFASLEDYLIQNEHLSIADFFTQQKNHEHKEKVLNSVKEFFIHTAVMMKKKIAKFPGVFELLAADFIIDSEYKIWFAGFQSNPSYVWPGDASSTFYEGMIKETIQIETRIRNERLRTARKYVADIHEDFAESKKVDYIVYSDKIKKELLAKPIKTEELNYFELILDSNLEGRDKFLNKLPSSCNNLIE